MNSELTDREILEACARACGLQYQRHVRGLLVSSGTDCWEEWDPLADTNEGRSQCAIMCAELGITSRPNNRQGWAVCEVYAGTCCIDDFQHYDDHQTKTAAWQAAACAVAAAIGEAMA
jgi:hypothetical protein